LLLNLYIELDYKSKGFFIFIKKEEQGMANNYMGNMTFGVNFKVDTHALDVLDTKFSQMSMDLRNLMQKGTATKDNALIKVAKDARVAYDQLYEAMNKAYNPKLGQFDLSKVNASLQSAGTNLTTVASALDGAGQNVNGILSTLMGNKLMIKETNQFLDKMAVTFGNTVRWSITNKIINTITGSIQKAFYFTKDLDRSLTNIRVVTGDSAEQMTQFATQANNAAKDLGRSTLDYTKAALSFYQQGLG
jgi:DNA-binding phage protein